MCAQAKNVQQKNLMNEMQPVRRVRSFRLRGLFLLINLSHFILLHFNYITFNQVICIRFLMGFIVENLKLIIHISICKLFFLIHYFTLLIAFIVSSHLQFLKHVDTFSLVPSFQFNFVDQYSTEERTITVEGNCSLDVWEGANMHKKVRV